MPVRFFLLFVIYLWGSASVGTAEERLRPPSYQPGREYVIRSTQTVETVLAVAGGQQAKSLAEMVIDLTTVCRRSAGQKNDGWRDLVIELTAMQMDVTMGGLELTYDSSEPGSEQTLLGQTFAAQVGQSFLVKLDPADQIVGTEGLEKFGAGDNPLAQQFGPEQLKQLAMPAMRLGVPATGAKMGDSWKKRRELNLGPSGEVEAMFDVSYTRDETLENRLHGVLEYHALVDADLQGQGTTMKIRDGRLHGAMSIDKSLGFPRTGMVITKMMMSVPNPATPGEEMKLPIEQSLQFDLLSSRKVR